MKTYLIPKIDAVELRAVNKAYYQLLVKDTEKLADSYHLPAELNVLFGEFMKEVHGLPLRCEGDSIERIMDQYLTLFVYDSSDKVIVVVILLYLIGYKDTALT